MRPGHTPEQMSAEEFVSTTTTMGSRYYFFPPHVLGSVTDAFERWLSESSLVVGVTFR